MQPMPERYSRSMAYHEVRDRGKSVELNIEIPAWLFRAVHTPFPVPLQDSYFAELIEDGLRYRELVGKPDVVFESFRDSTVGEGAGSRA